MSRRDMLTIILVNALVSLGIAVAVVLVALNLATGQGAAAPTPYVIVAPTPTPLLPATLIPTPRPSPSVATEVYTVQPGDTLLGIALSLGVDQQMLLDLNNLENADRLLAGQQLLVPLGSLPEASPTSAPPVDTPTATPAAPATTPATATPTETLNDLRGRPAATLQAGE